MLSKEQNELLTRVGPGTPCGELLRRYWQPVCVASELTPERPKKRVTVMGEDLVVFRDAQGGFGLLGEHCSHRGTSLYYGFLEDGGLRCAYHGWLYDSSGRCLEQPFEPAQSMMRHSIHHAAYPVEKLGGLLFTYMGPPDKKPLLPRWDVLVWQDGERSIRLQETLNCNWLQAQENSADVVHTYFLHAHMMRTHGLRGGEYYGRPLEQYGFQPFDRGIVKTWRYAGDSNMGAEDGGGNPLVFPNILRQQTGPWHNLHWRVPIDDTHTEIYVVNFNRTQDAGRSQDGRVQEQPEDPTVVMTDNQVLPNGDYALDSFFTQDKMAWETQGPLFDRSIEHLGASDRGIALLREALLEQIEVVRRGEDPIGTIRDPEMNEIVELPGWFVLSGDGVKVVRGATPRDIVSSEGQIDERHEVIEVPEGAARRLWQRPT